MRQSVYGLRLLAHVQSQTVDKRFVSS